MKKEIENLVIEKKNLVRNGKFTKKKKINITTNITNFFSHAVGNLSLKMEERSKDFISLKKVLNMILIFN